jgi:enamine deaminase RidA (YjgF/YER057c/UK114 family)
MNLNRRYPFTDAIKARGQCRCQAHRAPAMNERRPTVKRFLAGLVTITTVAIWLLAVPQGRSMPPQQAAASGSSVQHVQGTARQQNERAYSPAVISNGGKIVWLAGHSALVDSSGKSLAGDFDAQAKEVFAQIDRTLKRAGGSLQNVVTWTVYINDSRYGDRLVSIRKSMFPDGKFPGSALITVSNFDTPGVLVEIQGIAVIADRRM